MTKLSFDMIKLMTTADAVLPTQDAVATTVQTASAGASGSIATTVSKLGHSSQSGDEIAAQAINPVGDQDMSNIMSKARANRALALRIHALRSASVTNLFSPVEQADANLASERQHSNNDNTRRMLRSLPRFVSHRAVAQHCAA